KGENPFRISAYRKAAQTLEKDERSLTEIGDLSTLPGIGKGTHDLIVEYIETGKSTMRQQLQAEVPSGLIPLLKLPGLGGKRLAMVHRDDDVLDVKPLRRACEDGHVGQVKGDATNTGDNLVRAIENQASRHERLPVGYMLAEAQEIAADLDTISEK